MKHEHFKGKEALGHVIEARAKGKEFMIQEHGSVMPSSVSIAFGVAKEVAFTTPLLAIISFYLSPVLTTPFFLLFFLSFVLYQTAKTAITGWSRLQKLHRMIEEERYEIMHHRPQEKEELTALYKAKGFSGKLLEEVIDILMADDNRLLEVMLEEEFGLELEKLDHPLKQALGAFIGGFASTALLFIGLFIFPPLSFILISSIIVIITCLIEAIREKAARLPTVIWNLAIYYFIYAMLYFALQLFV